MILCGLFAMVELGDAINYTRNLFVGENASAGEAQAAIEQAFGAAVAIERCRRQPV